MTTPTTHDYSQRNWGHDYTFDPINGGQAGEMVGFGSSIKNGDYLILENKGGTTRYQVKSIEYYLDPPDMWKATVVFAPRSEKTGGIWNLCV